jgi:putative FmdB family regulatory protein
MPIYVYRCGSCNEYSEALQKASDPPLTRCPACEAEALVRVIAPVGVIFKGSGFHKNDYSGKSTSKSSGSESSKDSSAATSETSSAESKSDTTTSSSESKSGGSGDKVA